MWLSVSENNIERVSLWWTRRCRELVVLDLSGNPLAVADVGPIAMASDLREIRIDTGVPLISVGEYRGSHVLRRTLISERVIWIAKEWESTERSPDTGAPEFVEALSNTDRWLRIVKSLPDTRQP